MMSQAAAPASGSAPKPPAARRRFWVRLAASKFLLVSIIAHLFFGVGATYMVVQRLQAKRKLAFQAGPTSPNRSQRALEHKVSMAQKKKTGGAPPQAKRIVTTGLSKISMPEMPSMPNATMAVPGMASGIGGAGFGTGMGFGNGMGAGSGGGGGGGGLTLFGFKNPGAGGLPGEFYDLKQDRDRKPTDVDRKKYGEVVAEFIKSNWQEGRLRKYYKAPNPLFAGQILVPDIDAKLAPAAFQVEKEVAPERWVAHYKGKVIAPESGTFHFVGGGDDVLFVKFNGRTVLNGCCAELGGDEQDKKLGVKSEGRYHYGWTNYPLTKGDNFRAEAGQSYSVEILIGEWPGGRSHFVLLLEKEGGTYEKESHGSPILPVFRFAELKTPPLENGQTLPPYRQDGAIWRAGVAGTGSLLDALKR